MEGSMFALHEKDGSNAARRFPGNAGRKSSFFPFVDGSEQGDNRD
jgi:hypothetical protein